LVDLNLLTTMILTRRAKGYYFWHE
jgi:hypothetical protein